MIKYVLSGTSSNEFFASENFVRPSSHNRYRDTREMKAYIGVDIEGTAGITHWDEVRIIHHAPWPIAYIAPGPGLLMHWQ